MSVDSVGRFSVQALAVLERMRPVSGLGRWVFPSARTMARPMSNNAVLAALRSMGYPKETIVGHGFRSMFSTIANEAGLWSADAIERQLAHVPKDAVRAAYNHAELMDARREMMQWWADWLEKVADGA